MVMARRMSSGTCRAPGQQLRSATALTRAATSRFFIAAIGWITKRKSRPGGHRTAHFRNCRFATGSIA
jgi:hypothetical protein